jgi:hypothetical protein
MEKRYLLYIAVLIFAILNILIQNDQISLWEGTESLLAWKAMHQSTGFTPQELYIQFALSNELDLLLTRFGGLILLLVAGTFFWWAAKPILGQALVLNSLLLTAASLLVVNLAKVATGDIWALASQWITFTLLLRYLKQPEIKWRILFYLSLLLCIWIQPVNALIFILGFSAWLYFRHPNGKLLWRLNPWIAGLAGFGMLYAAQITTLSQDSFLIGWNSGRFLLWNLLGILPFIGFAGAGIWESFQKARKGEELGNILLGALLLGLASHAMILPIALAIMAGKQLKSYFAQNYPYKSIVRAGAVLHILLAACSIIALLMGAYFRFEIAGFRAGLFAGGVYWMWSFIAIIGLYGMNERYVRSGTVFSGIFFTLLFWLQVAPVIEAKRSWPVQLVEAAKGHPTVSADTATYCILYHYEEAPFPALAPYAKASFPNTLLIDSPSQLSATFEDSTTQKLYLLPEKLLPEAVDSSQIILGVDRQLQPVRYGWLFYRAGK